MAGTAGLGSTRGLGRTGGLGRTVPLSGLPASPAPPVPAGEVQGTAGCRGCGWEAMATLGCGGTVRGQPLPHISLMSGAGRGRTWGAQSGRGGGVTVPTGLTLPPPPLP